MKAMTATRPIKKADHLSSAHRISLAIKLLKASLSLTKGKGCSGMGSSRNWVGIRAIMFSLANLADRCGATYSAKLLPSGPKLEMQYLMLGKFAEVVMSERFSP
jgi:hypothetical protein